MKWLLSEHCRTDDPNLRNLILGNNDFVSACLATQGGIGEAFLPCEEVQEKLYAKLQEDSHLKSQTQLLLLIQKSCMTLNTIVL